jgi:hypothetical protein
MKGENELYHIFYSAVNRKLQQIEFVLTIMSRRILSELRLSLFRWTAQLTWDRVVSLKKRGTIGMALSVTGQVFAFGSVEF